jgi:glyoxylase-like metal-dependent hydrolase (beta-lactamase superfamily II)
MKKILNHLYTWGVFNQDKQLDFNGLYLRTPQRFVLIDPPPMQPKDIEMVESFGIPKKIYLTNKHHTRDSAEHRARWGSKIFIHEGDAPLMEIPIDGTFSDGELIEEELEAIRIPDAKTPGECAFYWPNNSVLIVGDALIGKPEGKVSMLSDDKFKDPRLARLGLSVLRGLNYDVLMVGDGHSILHNAKAVVDAFLKEVQA